MATSILSMVQDVCRRNSLSVPSSIVGTTDDQNISYIGIVNKALEDMTERFDWTALTREATFLTLATESQGTLESLGSGPTSITDMRSIIPETLFDRTLRLPLYGPVTASEWQALKSVPNTGPFYKFRIREDEFLMNPVPAAGHTVAFEYVSRFAARAADASLKEYYTADSDTILVNERAFKAYFEWMWKAAKGLDYAEDFRRAEELCLNARSRDGVKRSYDMGNPDLTLKPGVFVPAGNWMQP
jgi:hypothetical protein